MNRRKGRGVALGFLACLKLRIVALEEGLCVGRFVRFGFLVCVGLLASVVFALSSCSTEQQGGPSGEESEPPPREVTREVTQEVTQTVTVAEAP